jgi:hypothetical protein
LAKLFVGKIGGLMIGDGLGVSAAGLRLIGRLRGGMP